ncbi:hypothetical protein GCM10011332_02440 [Terasakiella brassicae]|uniref:Tetratricopeptide repeat protein n=1 Tax=Terasakiella brassicae TaxID=1634917 RepID=A0A917BPE6_9PROT|nr:hypothetical protein GCM10011332_02440 [Terasakiella brassicae]
MSGTESHAEDKECVHVVNPLQRKSVSQYVKRFEVKRQAFLSVTVILSLCAVAAQAEPIDHAKQYKACMQLVRQAPHKAFDSGLSWKGLGGGEAAEHCIASALIAMKRYETGAQRMEQLADTSRRSKEFKAQILAQAAQGWFLANENDRARAVLSTAINLDETNPDLYVDRAHVRASTRHYTDALDDLNKAVSLDENLVDAYVFRGTIYRLTENFEEAWRDINHALALMPDNADALLERGMLYRIEGHNDLARQDWMSAIEIDPQSETAQTARLNLERMDVKTME